MAMDDLDLTLLPLLSNSLGLRMCTSMLGFRERASTVSEATVEDEDQNTACGLDAQTLVLENSLDAPHREVGSSVLPLSCW